MSQPDCTPQYSTQLSELNQVSVSQWREPRTQPSRNTEPTLTVINMAKQQEAMPEKSQIAESGFPARGQTPAYFREHAGELTLALKSSLTTQFVTRLI